MLQEKTLHQLVREINACCKCGAGGSRLKAHFQAHGGGSQKALSFLRPRSLFYPERVKPDLFFLPAEDEEDEVLSGTCKSRAAEDSLFGNSIRC